MTVIPFIVGVFAPLMFVLGFYYGFRIAKDIYKDGNIKKETLPLRTLTEKAEDIFDKVTESDEERMQRIINENIEAYGTNIPQRDVK